MKKMILALAIFWITFLSVPTWGKAQTISLNTMYECKEDVKIYEKAEDNAVILGERKKGETLYVISEGTTWSEVFYGGKTGYVQTQYLQHIDRTGILEDKAFDEKLYLAEYEDVLLKTHEEDMNGHKDNKILVPCIAVIVVMTLIGADRLLSRQRKRRRK